MKKLIFIALVAVGGCGGSSNNGNGNPDMAMQQANPDMSPTCFSGTPSTNEEFLNACTTASSVDITPFYPAKAPGGVLPPLQ